MRNLFPLGVAAGLLIATAASAQPLVSSAWLAEHLHDPDLRVLDIRSQAKYAQGHIQGAVAADYEGAGWRVAQPDGAGGALPPIAKIAETIGSLGVGDTIHAIVVGDDFGAEARVYWTIKVLGHDDVSILDGGQHAWQSAGRPIDAAPVPVTAARFTPRYDPSLRATLAEVEQDVAHGDATLVDARPPAQWNGTAKSPVVHAYGHLPGAVWIDQSEALTPDGKLKPKADLEVLFAKAGDKPVTTYCNTGHLAATDWFVLSEVLNHPQTKLYDASMSQWTADPARPVSQTDPTRPAAQTDPTRPAAR